MSRSAKLPVGAERVMSMAVEYRIADEAWTAYMQSVLCTRAKRRHEALAKRRAQMAQARRAGKVVAVKTLAMHKRILGAYYVKAGPYGWRRRATDTVMRILVSRLIPQGYDGK